jgi:hypothetical protein
MWGWDLIDNIYPPLQRHTFIITSINYFKKWVKVVLLQSMTNEVIFHFILDKIISQFGFPFDLVFDNGSSFKNKQLNKFLEKFYIQHHFSMIYYPQSNGQVEASNKKIEQILQKAIKKHGKN